MNLDIFDSEEIKISLGTPLDYTAFIKMDSYLDATKALIKTGKSSKGGDLIYYVECPNAAKHGSDSATATMIFVQEQEKNPIFLCHHSSCKHLTFADFVSFHSKINPMQYLDDGAYMEYQGTDHKKPSIASKLSRDTEEQQELAKEISFYGYDFENHFYFGSTDSFMLTRFKANDLTERNCYAILSDQTLWFLAFSSMGKKESIMYWQNAAEWLIRKSKEAGPFKSKNVRLLGIHKEKESFVLNTGTNVKLLNGKEYTYHAIRELFKTSLYFPASGNITISACESSYSELEAFLSVIEKWPFKSPFDVVKFVGLIICGMVPGGLDTRPCGWLTAESGSGKTQVFTYLVSVLWKAAGAAICDKGTTAAGIESAAKGSNVSIAYDEAEATTETGNRKMTAVMDQVLSAATNGTGETYKSNPYGHTLSFKSQSCYLFGSVGDKVDSPTLKRRIAVFSLLDREDEKYKTYYSPNWRNLKKETKALITPEFAGKLFLYIFNHLELLNKNIDLVESYLIEKTKIGSEIIGLYSAIFGAYLSIRYKFNIEPESFDCLLPFLAELEQEYKSSEAEKCTGVIMMNTLLDVGIVKTFDNKNVYIADLISVVLGGDNFNNPIGFTINNAIDLLSKSGIKVVPEEKSIVVSNTNWWIKEFFDKRGHVNHSSRLKTYPGAKPTKGPVHFYKSGSTRGVMIPLGEEFFIKTVQQDININGIFDNTITWEEGEQE